MEKIEKDFNSVKKRIGFTTSISFVRFGYYFQDDRDMRNVYSLTIKRNGKSASFTFGDSVANSIINGRNTTEKKPKDYEIIYALVQDYYSFENALDLNDFMYSYGYEDKKVAQKILNRLKKDYDKLNRIFTSEEMQMIARVYEENNY